MSCFISIVVDLEMDIIHTSHIAALLCYRFVWVERIGMGRSLWERPWDNPYPFGKPVVQVFTCPLLAS